MSSYSTSQYSLAFSTDYKKVQVLDGETVEEEFSLIDHGPLAIKVENGDFVLNYESPVYIFSEAYDLNLDEPVVTSFQNQKAIGIGIIDLRDTGRTRKEDHYLLTQQTLIASYIPGNSKPLILGIKSDPPSDGTDEVLICEYK